MKASVSSGPSRAAAPPPDGDVLAPWRAVIESMLHAVWLVDAQSLRVVAANHAAGTLMGVRATELVGMEVLDLAATPEDLCFWGEVASGQIGRAHV